MNKAVVWVNHPYLLALLVVRDFYTITTVVLRVSPYFLTVENNEYSEIDAELCETLSLVCSTENAETLGTTLIEIGWSDYPFGKSAA